jgi:hypothetical protein
MLKQHVSIISFKNIFVCLVLQRNLMLLWPSFCVKRTYIKIAYILVTICMKVRAPMNKNFYHLGLCALLRFLSHLRFCVHWSSFGSSSNAPRCSPTSLWVEPCILMFFPLTFQNGNSFYVNPFADFVKWTKITQWSWGLLRIKWLQNNFAYMWSNGNLQCPGFMHNKFLKETLAINDLHCHRWSLLH